MSKLSIKQPLRYSLACLMGVGLCATSFYPIATLAEDNYTSGMMCHAVADNDKLGGSEDKLIIIYEDGKAIEVGTGTGTLHMEAVSFDFSGETLYAIAEPDDGSEGSRFGTLDLDENSPTWGQFLPIGNGLGTGTCDIDGDGQDDQVTFDDVDGLTFDYADPTGNTAYATLRREHLDPQQYDVLFQIDPRTGKSVPGGFNGKDCVVVKVNGYPQYFDVDDIASDPEDGTLYIVANTGDGVESVLATLERTNGVPTGNATFVGSNDVDDIESLDFEKTPQPDGSYQLYGTTGNGGAKKGLDPTAKNHIYLIDKSSGMAAPKGTLQKSEQINQDYEAVSCQPMPPSCVMYAIHDEKVVDTQVFEINPFAGNGIGSIRPVGPFYPRRDLEGLSVVSIDGEKRLYATSGSDQKKGIPDGALYQMDMVSGALNFIGLSGYSELSSLAVRPSDNTLWAWARGGYTKDGIVKGDLRNGPVKLNHETGEGTLLQEFDLDFDIQAVAWSNDGKTLYGAMDGKKGTELHTWTPNDPSTTPICAADKSSLGLEGLKIEAMEMQNNGLLLLSAHNETQLGIFAYNPQTCEVVATRDFELSNYNDIESIAWSCDDRSWLYTTSGEVEIELDKYRADLVPTDAVDAIWYALGGAENNDNVSVESKNGKITIVITDENGKEQVYKAEPAILPGIDDSDLRRRLVAGTLNPIADTGCWQLNYEDGDGNQSMTLCPVAACLTDMENVLGQYGKVDVGAGTLILFNDQGNTIFKGRLAIKHNMPSYEEDKPIPVAVSDAKLEQVSDQIPYGKDKGDGIADWQFTCPNGTTQTVFTMP